MKPNYKPPFVSFVKKQRMPFQLVIEDTVEALCVAPDLGEAKFGDLQGIRVHKFTYNRQQYLIAYRPPMDDVINSVSGEIDMLFIDFYQIGTHENFYADLKKYLKS